MAQGLLCYASYLVTSTKYQPFCTDINNINRKISQNYTWLIWRRSKIIDTHDLSFVNCWLKNSDGLKNVRSSIFDRSKPKIGCSSSITNRWTLSSSFNVQKSDVRVSSMSDLVNVEKAVLGSTFDFRSFEAKNRVFEFDHQQMNTFEFVRCSLNDVRVRLMFDKMVFDPSLVSPYFFLW